MSDRLKQALRVLLGNDIGILFFKNEPTEGDTITVTTTVGKMVAKFKRK